MAQRDDDGGPVGAVAVAADTVWVEQHAARRAFTLAGNLIFGGLARARTSYGRTEIYLCVVGSSCDYVVVGGGALAHP